MEYEHMVHKIVEAEHSATELVQEAKAKQAHLQQDLQQEITAMHDRYMERAKHRLQLVAETEEASAQESIARWDKKLEQAMAAVEDSYAKNKEDWVNTLFSLIVDAQP